LATRLRQGRKALGISPLCADAYVLLAEEARSIEEARDYYAKGVQAGGVALGPRGFKQYAGHFWGFLETAPICGPGPGLANTLLLGDVDSALGHYRDMLKLNPNDNQGMRLNRRKRATGAFRATGITAYLANGGALEHAQEMAAHESPRTTKLYDRTWSGSDCGGLRSRLSRTICCILLPQKMRLPYCAPAE
jgi:hypothetical protein